MNDVLEKAKDERDRAAKALAEVAAVRSEARNNLMERWTAHQAQYKAEGARLDEFFKNEAIQAQAELEKANVAYEKAKALTAKRQISNYRENPLIIERPRKVSMAKAKKCALPGGDARMAYNEQFPTWTAPQSGREYMVYGIGFFFKDPNLPGRGNEQFIYEIPYAEHLMPRWEDTEAMAKHEALMVGRAIQRSHFWTKVLLGAEEYDPSTTSCDDDENEEEEE